MTYNKFRILDINWMGDQQSPYQFTVRVELMSSEVKVKKITFNLGNDYPNENTIKEAVESYIEREKLSAIEQVRMRSLLGKVIDL